MGETTDFLIIGGGVIGLALALELNRREPRARITLLEKEATCGEHASGRNSGVLHAGFYYTADSLKARFCRDGNREWQTWCEAHKIPINRCGKLVVARDPGDWPAMAELLSRAQANGVRLEAISEAEARKIEPRVKTADRALYSPDTASVDPPTVMAALAAEAEARQIRILTRTPYLGHRGGEVRIPGGSLAAGYVINAAGLYADRVARDFGFARELAILPFKGLYLYGDEPAGALATNIYPVPDLGNPFLGVHFTVTATGKIKIGPTALPAFWREHYRGLERFHLGEGIAIAGRQLGLLLGRDATFRRLAWREMGHWRRGRMVALAGELAHGIDPGRWRTWGRPGLRAQLLQLSTGRLVTDFHYQGDSRSFHVLNVVSPGFTSAFPFARHLAEAMASGREGRPLPDPTRPPSRRDRPPPRP
ncbi:MAG: FAD-dependent oxidoreductase [Magnetococcales bacterium]|nr:FAD-dependent oxidoreductase [Magnetococcales bacterium]